MIGATPVFPSDSTWTPDRALRRTEEILRGVAGGEPPGRVLKENEHGAVVWVDGAGPDGADVVVKSRRPNTRWSQWRDRLGGSPARAQRAVASACREAGVEVPEVLAIDDDGWPDRPCRVVMRAVSGAIPLLDALRDADPRTRRALARGLGRFVARLHASGLYVPDLKHDNFLVVGADATSGGGAGEGDPPLSFGAAEPRLVLVDLDRARQPARGVSHRRRIRNLVQLHWRLSWEATPREQLRMLGEYLRALGGRSRGLAALAREVDRAQRRKQRRLLAKRRRMGERPAERPGVSAMIICQDEIRRIRPCLESVAWCDEIVVVDGGSTDGTLEVCREYTDRVFSNPWPGHRAQKQFALDRTTMPWVLNVDSDERVPAPLRAELEWILAHDGAGFDGFQVPRLVRYLSRWWWRGGWYPSRRLRLFRREMTEWGGVDPHEKAVVHGPIGRIHEPLWHLSYEDVAHHLRSIDRLTEVAARARPRRARWDRLYLRPPARFVRSWVVGRGFVEGFPGFFIALASALYVHVKYVKADEEARARRAEP